MPLISPGYAGACVAVVACLPLLGMAGAHAASERFDTGAAGALPQGWSCGVTGTGEPKWAVEADPSAPTPPNVLKQSGQGTFPWCVKQDAAVADGIVEVKFKRSGAGWWTRSMPKAV